MTTKLTWGTLAVVLMAAGWLAGTRQAVEAQVSPISGEWRMFSENVAGGTSGARGGIWIYHTGTGDVRYIQRGCGELCPMILPVLNKAER